jgi:hyperosmotically inducible periplasmic protein
MRNKSWLLRGLATATIGLLISWTPGAVAAQVNKAHLDSPENRDARRMESLKTQVRHQLVMLPYYSVFDWLEAEVDADGSVTLTGQVIRPTTKSDAGGRIKRLEGATPVVNNIEVLPLSRNDDDLRLALYRAIYRYNSPLFRYATQSIPPIHIIVKNGRAVLKGFVQNQADSQLAYIAASGVSGVFEVKNELQIEQGPDGKVSSR